jgi:two-component system, OmpR family, sensor histidine kinase KdpD
MSDLLVAVPGRAAQASGDVQSLLRGVTPRITLGNWMSPSEGQRPATGRSPSRDATGAVESTGHLRIYLAVASGAGKTMAMLAEGHRRRERGADVVIALAESHGRSATRQLAVGLETIPRRPVRPGGDEFREGDEFQEGDELQEMDLDAVLRRHPQVALVDELGHTNVTGTGRHNARWQDVLDLLDAGIDVITTVDVQHLEGVADAAERITGVPVRERVPDWVVRKAERIELVNSSPEQLRARMVHATIYPPGQVARALAHRVSADNLAALRELALGFLAEQMDAELADHLARNRPSPAA